MAADEQKTVVRRYFEEYHNGRRGELAAQLLAPELVEPTRRMTAAVRTAFPDYRIAIKAQLAEGELVSTVWTMRGRHQGEWASPIGPIPPTGRTVEVTGTTTLRVAGQKIAEVIGTNWDHLGILQQLDAVASVAPRSGA